MKISQSGIDLIKQFEGCRLQAYKPVPTEQYWTIGYGHYGPDVNAGMVINQAQADAYLREDLIKFENKVNKFDGVYHWTQNEFDAMVSFAYNIGSIDGLTSNGTRTKEVIADKIPLYNKAGGKVLAGLTKRRNAERNLFLGNKITETVINPVLKIGSKGDYVKSVQTYLSILGYQVGNIDGIYGKQTATSVKQYQESNGLKVDGIWGSQCWNSVKKQ